VARSIDDLEFSRVEATDEGFREYADAVSLHFHESWSEDDTAGWREITEFDRTWVARDGGRIVGNSASISFRMSLPGGREAACGGLTAVGVAPDWRRRGLLTRMVRWHLDDTVERGEPFAALYASESPIYGRYGYGIAAPCIDLEVETQHASLLRPVTPDEADVRLVDVDTIRSEAPAIHEGHRRVRGGMMDRTEAWWDAWFRHDPPGSRQGHTARQHALVPGRGYAIYRTKSDWQDTLPQGVVAAIEIVATDPVAYAALWQHLFSLDLVRTVKSRMEPADSPLLSLVANHQRLKTRGSEDLYLRLVDLPAALAARAYDVDDTLTFAVHDAFLPANEGTWTLHAADGEASCERSDREPDLELDIRELAAICLGGVTATHHVWARRIEERTSGAAARADRLFATDLAPWNPFEF
jgi:predicted acetyltransferase